MFRSVSSWMVRQLKMLGIALGIALLLIIFAAASDAANRPPRPTYERDSQTGLCFAKFERKDGSEHLLVPCTPEVLRQVR